MDRDKIRRTKINKRWTRHSLQDDRRGISPCMWQEHRMAFGGWTGILEKQLQLWQHSLVTFLKVKSFLQSGTILENNSIAFFSWNRIYREKIPTSWKKLKSLPCKHTLTSCVLDTSKVDTEKISQVWTQPKVFGATDKHWAIFQNVHFKPRFQWEVSSVFLYFRAYSNSLCARE